MVTQEDSLGCGVASVAYVLGITYKDAMLYFDPNEVKKSGCYCKDLLGAMKENKINCCYKYLRKHLRKKIYKLRTIVFIKKSKKYPAGHYLVRTNDGWHDSWINFQKNKDIKNAKSGIRKRLPGKAIYAIFITS
jgi:hypothetical protein